MDVKLVRGDWAGEPVGENPGRYRIERLVGEGGMGAVYLAYDVKMDRFVGLKVLEFRSKNGEVYDLYLRRFEREARATARLTTKHVVKVYDWFVSNELGLAFITMEFLRGCDWAKYLERLGGRIGAEGQDMAFEAFAQVAFAVAEAHVKKIVHRDLKPANLFREDEVDGDWVMKILDFGIAGMKDVGGNDLTKEADRIGTIDYMSPQQLFGNMKQLGPETDVFALGAVIYESFTGTAPYTGPPLSQGSDLPGFEPDQSQLIARRIGVFGEGPERWELMLPMSLSLACRNFIMRMIALDAESRPTAGEVCHFFSDLGRRRHPTLPQAQPSLARGSGPVEGVPPRGDTTTPEEPARVTPATPREAVLQPAPNKVGQLTFSPVTSPSRQIIRRSGLPSRRVMLLSGFSLSATFFILIAVFFAGKSPSSRRTAATQPPVSTAPVTQDAGTASTSLVDAAVAHVNNVEQPDVHVAPEDAGQPLLVASNDAGQVSQPSRRGRHGRTHRTPRVQPAPETPEQLAARERVRRLTALCCRGFTAASALNMSSVTACPPRRGSSGWRALNCDEVLSSQ